MKAPSNLLVHGSIPFGDQTHAELASLARTEGVSIAEAQRAELHPSTILPNPTGVYDKFYTPIGKILVDGAIFNDAANAVATGKSINQIVARLEKLKSAVRKETGRRKFESGDKGFAYINACNKFIEWVADPLRRPLPSPIFVLGNEKLPFWQFSTIPGVTCPGAGECLTRLNPKRGQSKRGYCYSFKGWRNIYPFFRQLMNTMLLRLDGGRLIRDEWMKLPQGETIRLYVDGDVDSRETLDFWMDLCHLRSDLHVYAYSKSWKIFIKRHRERPNDWPENYVLNISNSSRYWNDKELREAVAALPITRGLFISIDTMLHGAGTHMPKWDEDEMGPEPKDFDNRTLPGHAEHMEDVKNTAKSLGVSSWVPGQNKSFIWACPGFCHNCMVNPKTGENVHACGNKRLTGVPIVIGIH